MADVLYRYDLQRWAAPLNEFDEPIGRGRLTLECREFRVLKWTPCGAWIEHGFDKKFVLLTARKQFACRTKEEAAMAFRARKKRQIHILKSQLAEAITALAILTKHEQHNLRQWHS